MTTIQVCVGSACHLKGSYNIFNAFQALITEHEIGDKVTIKATFCLDHCSEAVSVKVDDDEEIYSLSVKTVDDFFNKTILPRV